MADQESSSSRSAGNASRSTARLAAVQALYQHAIAGTPVERIISEGIHHSFAGALDDQELVPPDRALFARIVRGVHARRDDLDGLVDGALEGSWSRDRLETLLVAILRAGCWELLDAADPPTRIVIKDYIDLTHAFFAGREPGMVNAVLDKIARRVRDDLAPAGAASTDG
ncbi:MAG: transcription antitermination factor NusB [Rhodospirillaceae bacterium]|nr:transcription antitermination factor NusB [Rhodospirillaceae bacterium]